MSPASSTTTTTTTTTTLLTTNKPTTSTTTTQHNPSSTTTSSSSATTQACAACKYQRRRCQPDCPLAPYFPADQQQMFLNAHRLFGVSNIRKTLINLDPSLHNQAMHSIIFHSNARAQDPVLGCYGIVLELQHQIALHQREIELIYAQLPFYRSQASSAHNHLPLHHLHHQQHQQPSHADLAINPNPQVFDVDGNGGGQNIVTINDVNSNNESNDVIYFDHEQNDVIPEMDHSHHQHLQQQYYFYNTTAGGGNGNEMEGPPPPLSPVMSGGGKPEQQQRFDEDDVKPFIDLFDVRELAAAAVDATEDEGESKNLASFHCSSSSKSELKGESNFIEHDLKDAASLLSLTNCNASAV